MLIGSLCVVFVFIAFIIITYFITKKSCVFNIGEDKVKIANAGNSCKIFVNDKLYQTYFMPQLINGESFDVVVGGKNVVINCKCNWFGNKLWIQALIGHEEVFNNGVKIKKKSNQN